MGFIIHSRRWKPAFLGFAVILKNSDHPQRSHFVTDRIYHTDVMMHPTFQRLGLQAYAYSFSVYYDSTIETDPGLSSYLMAASPVVCVRYTSCSSTISRHEPLCEPLLDQ